MKLQREKIIILLVIPWLLSVIFVLGTTYKSFSLCWTDPDFALARQVDFRCYYGIATMLHDGNPGLYNQQENLPYQEKVGTSGKNPVRITYPPSFYFMFLPFTFIPLETAARVWIYLQTLLIPVAALLLGSLVLRDEKRLWLRLLTIAAFTLAIFAFTPVMDDIFHGQVSLALLVLLLGAFHLIRGGREIPGGILLGLVFCLKFISVFLIIYYALRRKWKAVISAGVVIMAVNLGVLLRYGINIFFEYFRTLPGSLVFYWRDVNQSIPAKILNYIYIWRLNVPFLPGSLRIAFYALALVIMGVTFYLIFRKKTPDKISTSPDTTLQLNQAAGKMPAPPDNIHSEAFCANSCETANGGLNSDYLDFSLIITATVLVSPLVWTYYHVWLLVPFSYILYKWIWKNEEVRYGALIFGVSAVMFLMTASLDGMSGDGLYEFRLCFIKAGVFLLINIIIWAFLLFIKKGEIGKCGAVPEDAEVTQQARA